VEADSAEEGREVAQIPLQEGVEAAVINPCVPVHEDVAQSRHACQALPQAVIDDPKAGKALEAPRIRLWGPTMTGRCCTCAYEFKVDRWKGHALGLG
jgi:hypothetical protein